jgi:sulfate permease, SulP family
VSDSKTQIISQLKRQWLLSMLVSLVIGMMEAMFAVSFAMLIFSGELAGYLPAGIAIAILSGMILRAVIGLMSSYPGMIADIDALPSAILGLSAAAIAAKMPPSSTPEDLFITVMGAIALTSLMTGAFLFLLDFFKVGELIRFIPYPVIGGFLAGVGCLLVQGAIQVMTNIALTFSNLATLVQPQAFSQCLVGLGTAIILLIVSARSANVLVIPITLFAAIGLFYLVLLFTQTSIDTATVQGWLLQSAAKGEWRFFNLSTLTQINGAIVFSQWGNMVTIALLSAISVLLNSTGIELSTAQDIDLNRELKAAGSANLILGFVGGITGYQILPDTILANKMGAKTRLVSLFMVILYVAILIWGFSLLSLFPLPIMGSLLLFMGLSLLKEWLYDTWFSLPKTDYGIVWLILLVMVTIGFLQGIGFGLAVAIVLFVINYSQVKVAKHVLSGAIYPSHTARSVQQSRLLREEGDQIYILELQGFLFFGTANKLLNQIRRRLQHPDLPLLKFVVLSFRTVTGLDSSAVLSFTKLLQIAQQQQLLLVFTHLSPSIERQFHQRGVLRADNYFCQVFSDLDRGIEWCENQILEAIPQRRRRSLPLALQLDAVFTNTDHVSGFMKYLEELNMEMGQVLFHQGDAADSFYFIEIGQVSVFLELEEGQAPRLQSLGAGNPIGEMNFYLRSPHQTSALVDQPSTLYRLSWNAAQRMQQEQPEVAITFQEFVIRLLSDRLSSSYKEITDLLRD